MPSISSKDRERAAARCIQAVLGVEVHGEADDGSEERMYDLEIRYPDRPAAPAEVTSILDNQVEAVYSALDKADGGDWDAPSLNLRWTVNIKIEANVKRLRKVLEPTLKDAEKVELDRFNDEAHHQLRREVRQTAPATEQLLAKVAAADALSNLGIRWATANIPDPSGSRVWISPGSGGGAWGGTDNEIVEWLENFLADPRRVDNLLKRSHSGSDEAHIFMYVDMHAVDFAVWRALSDPQLMPTSTPRLLAPYTHAWLVGTGAATGIRWDPDQGWSRFIRNRNRIGDGDSAELQSS